MAPRATEMAGGAAYCQMTRAVTPVWLSLFQSALPLPVVWSTTLHASGQKGAMEVATTIAPVLPAFAKVGTA